MRGPDNYSGTRAARPRHRFDQDTMVRQLITDALQMHGYKVLAASNGDEALLVSNSIRDRST